MNSLPNHTSIHVLWHDKAWTGTVSKKPDRIVFTSSKGLPGVGFSRAEWNAINDMQSGTVSRTITDTTLPTGPVERTLEYHAPFTLQNRETDYATVWAKLDSPS